VVADPVVADPVVADPVVADPVFADRQIIGKDRSWNSLVRIPTLISKKFKKLYLKKIKQQ
jgi:hypothetical protein